MSETPKTARPISPLRARMIEDMNVRNFVPDTQREYIRARAENIERARELLGEAPTHADAAEQPAVGDAPGSDLPPCPCCGARLRIIETFERGATPRHRPTPRPLVIRIDTS